MTPFEALMHNWIIEGLPPKVLVYHKRRLGINDDVPIGNPVHPNHHHAGHRSLKPLVAVKEKTMNRTCLLSDALRNDEPLLPEP